MRTLAVTGMAMTLLLGAGRIAAVQAAQEPRRWVAFDGRDWTGFAPREKQAYVAGFLAGAAAAVANTRDTAVVRRSVDSLYQAGALRFPFGHMVYANQLDEFYWWDNHVPIPLHVALASINQRLGQPGREPQSGALPQRGGQP
jgi:hypothetical protein